jgi:hypothetical protein
MPRLKVKYQLSRAIPGPGVGWYENSASHPEPVALQGGSLTERRGLQFGNLRRTNDGFFLKASYLFRL